jgi:hypothetical protein
MLVYNATRDMIRSFMNKTSHQWCTRLCCRTADVHCAPSHRPESGHDPGHSAQLQHTVVPAVQDAGSAYAKPGGALLGTLHDIFKVQLGRVWI